MPIFAVVQSCGFAWYRDESTTHSGRVTIVFVPNTEQAEIQLPWQTEKLMPVVASVQEVQQSELIEHPVLKV